MPDENKIKAEMALAEATDNFNALDRLYQSRDWDHFVTHELASHISEQHDMALDTKLSPQSRDYAAQKYEFGRELASLLSVRRQFWANRAGIKLSV